MKRVLVATIVGLLAAAPAVAADTLESAKKQIHDKVAAYRTIQFKSHTVTDMETPQMTMKSTTDMTVAYQKKGAKALSRMESKTASTTKFGDTTQKSDMTALSINDGEFRYTLSDASGQKSASKAKADPKTDPSPFDQMALFAMTEQYQTLKLLPEETVDGKPAFVIEQTMKNPTPGMPIGKTKVYYDKSTGISVKALGYDDKGKVTMTSTTTDIKLDANVAPDQFVFKAPPGVTVQDDTKGQ